jgi:PPOX class probable F420-dependent enzyme
LTERGNPPGLVVRDRPYAPGYGISSAPEGLLPWSRVEERLSAARNYWVATTRPDGRPHVTPVWGLWVDGTFFFGGTPRSRKARNLAENPNVAVHPDSEGDVVVILEGVAEIVTDPAPALSERVATASTAKYGMGSSDIEGSYAVRPRVVFAWLESDFPNTATRWLFERS